MTDVKLIFFRRSPDLCRTIVYLKRVDYHVHPLRVVNQVILIENVLRFGIFAVVPLNFLKHFFSQWIWFSSTSDINCVLLVIELEPVEFEESKQNVCFTQA
jgi:hypothetical protein